MASLFLGILENMLGLTESEKAIVEPCLPAAKIMVDALNAHLDDLWALNNHYVTEQTTVKRAFDDYRRLGPNLSQLLGDGWVDLATTASAVQDLRAAWQNCPAVPDIMAIYSRSAPDLDVVATHWPQVKPALMVILDAWQRRGVTVGNVVESLMKLR